MNPIARTTLEVLALAQREHATELVIGLSDPDLAPVRYQVAGKWYDWKSPGRDLVPGVVAELARLAEFTRRPFPKEALIDVPYSGVRLLWVIRMSSPEDDCVLTAVDP